MYLIFFFTEGIERSEVKLFSPNISNRSTLCSSWYNHNLYFSQTNHRRQAAPLRPPGPVLQFSRTDRRPSHRLPVRPNQHFVGSGLAEQVGLARGQQQEPEELVVPTLWQWLRKGDGLHPSQQLLLLLEQVAGIPLFLDPLQLGETLAPIASCPISKEKNSKWSCSPSGAAGEVCIFWEGWFHRGDLAMDSLLHPLHQGRAVGGGLLEHTNQVGVQGIGVVLGPLCCYWVHFWDRSLQLTVPGTDMDQHKEKKGRL